LNACPTRYDAALAYMCIVHVRTMRFICTLRTGSFGFLGVHATASVVYLRWRCAWTVSVKYRKYRLRWMSEYPIVPPAQPWSARWFGGVVDGDDCDDLKTQQHVRGLGSVTVEDYYADSHVKTPVRGTLDALPGTRADEYSKRIFCLRIKI